MDIKKCLSNAPFLRGPGLPGFAKLETLSNYGNPDSSPGEYRGSPLGKSLGKSCGPKDFYRVFPLWKTPRKNVGKHGGKTLGKDPPGEIQGGKRGEIPV